jgi:hypothetical protein
MIATTVFCVILAGIIVTIAKVTLTFTTLVASLTAEAHVLLTSRTRKCILFLTTFTSSLL